MDIYNNSIFYLNEKQSYRPFEIFNFQPNIIKEYETDEIYIILSPIDKTKTIENYKNLGGKPPQIYNYNSRDSKLLTKEEIISILERENLI